MKHTYAIRLACAGLLGLLVVSTTLRSQEVFEKSRTRLKAANKAYQKEKTTGKDDAEARFRQLSWRLLLGDFAGDPELKLSTLTREYLEKEVREFEALQKDEALMKRIRSNSGLLLRLDQLLLRQAGLIEKEKLAVKEDRERLQQLRDLGTTYRELTGELAAINTYALLGDDQKIQECFDRTNARIEALEKIAGRRIDYYLFKPEPKADAKEIELLTKTTQPLVDDMISHFRSLQAMAAYKLAERNTRDASKRKAALEKALSLVKEPKESGLGWYVNGLCNEGLGLVETEGKPFDAPAHESARKYFAPAKEAFQKAGEKLKGQQKELIEENLKQHQGELSASKWYLDRAAQATSKGKVDEAVAILERGVRMYREPALVTALAEALIRADRTSAETRNRLADATRAGALAENDPAGMLLRGRAEIMACWDEIWRMKEKDTVAPAVAKRLIGDLITARERLAQVAKVSKDERLIEAATAYRALAFSYASFLDEKSKDAEAAFGQLKRHVETLGQQAMKGEEAERLRAQEALVAARLAQGFLAIRFAPSYREDAALAFMAAADEQAKLKFGQASVKLFGSPVLSGLLSRPDMQGLKVAAEERQLRELSTRVAEGLAARELGQKKAAAEQMKAALSDIESLSGDPPVNAAKLLDRKEADARATLKLRARALAVLTLIAGGQTETALLEGLKLAPGGEGRTLETLSGSEIKAAAKSITDPLAAYALGLAVEEYAANRLTGERAASYFEAARESQDSTVAALAKFPSLATRYQQLPGLTSDAIERLTKPESYLEKVISLRQQTRILEAATLVEEGLKRHPINPALQEERILVKLDEADLSPPRSREIIARTVAEADKASEDGVLKDPRGLVALGEAHERLGQIERAMAAYQKALDGDPSDEQKLKATLRMSILKARLDGVSPPRRK